MTYQCLLNARIFDYARTEYCTGRFLKVRLFSSLLQNSKIIIFLYGCTPNILSAARHVLIDWSHQKLPFFSEPPALHIPHIPPSIPGSGGQVALGAVTTGQAQSGNALGTSFVLEGLFGDANA